MACADGDPVRRDDQLRRARAPHRPAGARPRGRTANGQNPIAVIVPCHRVIGSNGKLVGYGGGLENKQLLLDLERGIVPLAL
ncbi:MAG TPA: methylated-DNA--[protein]-cysteine S-methyltransferase [Thermoleophilaceae bacterium]|nr:methylated-DNA--[protein]-cysteine S-methyltransferase [Thermoleophilaceae bacterium]